MNQFFESLKRLFASRTPPPAETNAQPSADRPPPVESAEPESPPSPATLDATPAVDDASDISEVRALLEGVAEPPVAAAEPEADAPPTAPEHARLFPEAATEQIVDVPSEVVDTPAEVAVIPSTAPVGDALVLTLATPAATFTVAKATATIGRGQENTIRLDDLSVSRRHARIAYKQGGYWLSDLGSMGGTWVDGTRLNAPQRIDVGQIIDIGLCRLTVSSVGGAAKSETKKSVKPRSEMAEQGRRQR